MKIRPMARKCKICGEPFKPTYSTLQKECSYKCMADAARERRVKTERKELRVRRAQIKTRAQWLRETQAVFNKFIRLRDANEPCISCGRHHSGQYHAGHYRTVGSHPELRFSELNCHKQCAPCNNHKSGNIVEYRISLSAKIGADNLYWLEGPHEPKKYTIDDLKLIKAEYKAKIKETENE